MYKRFVVEDKINSSVIDISNEEHNHIANVIRMQEGDKIIVTCNDEYDYLCEISGISKKSTTCTILEKKINIANPKKTIDVYQALVKNDKMSIIVQKLNELGVSKLKLFETKYQTVKPSENKKDKLQKISNQSSKQCKRSMSMLIEDSIKFNDMLKSLSEYDLVLFANECEDALKINQLSDKITKTDKIAIIIGSEGGFDKSEIENIVKNGGVSVSLGHRILRAETASIALAGHVSFLLDN